MKQWIEVVNICDLKNYEHQPKQRMDPKTMQALLRSIQEDGLLMPILINKQKVIIDGHRRVECYKQLGLNKIHALVYDGADSETNVFCNINNTQRKMNAIELLSSYLLSGRLAESPILRHIRRVEEDFGRAFLLVLEEKNISIYSVINALCIASNIPINKKDEKLLFLNWCIKHSMFSQIRSMKKLGFNLSVITKYIKNDVPIEKHITFK